MSEPKVFTRTYSVEKGKTVTIMLLWQDDRGTLLIRQRTQSGDMVIVDTSTPLHLGPHALAALGDLLVEWRGSGDAAAG